MGQPYLENPDSARGKFQHAQIAWLNEHNKIGLPCDIDWPTDPEKSGGSLRQTLRGLFDLSTHIDGVIDMSSDEKTELATLATFAYHRIREPMLLGQAGYWLSHANPTPPLMNNEPFPLIVGSFHEPFADSVREYTGREPQVFRTGSMSNRGDIFRKVLQQGHVAPAQMNQLRTN